MLPLLLDNTQCPSSTLVSFSIPPRQKVHTHANSSNALSMAPTHTHAFNATLANLTRSRQSPLGTIAQLLYVHSTAATGRQSRRLGRHRHGNVFGFFGRHASFYRASHAFLPLVGTASASHRLYDLWRSTRAASTIATTASASASTASSTSITSSSTTSIPSARSHLRQNR